MLTKVGKLSLAFLVFFFGFQNFQIEIGIFCFFGIDFGQNSK